ncbi:MAG: M23 family metallopeptidase [Candidatus Dormibacter sp.]
MSAPVVAVRLLSAKNVRKLLGCGCLGAVVIVALPLFMAFSLMSGLLSGVTGGAAGGSQADEFTVGGALMVVGSGEPLQPRTFAVSQGFGCTGVGVEPPPPAPYACPPDAGHTSFVRFHSGIDLAAPPGTPVFAVAAGTVRVVQSATGFGLHIQLIPPVSTGRPVLYLYGHLSGVAVADGVAVVAGQMLGSVGSTGNSTGPHLHFEVDVGGVPVNPCSIFPAGYLQPAGVAAAGCLAWAT